MATAVWFVAGPSADGIGGGGLDLCACPVVGDALTPLVPASTQGFSAQGKTLLCC